MALYEERLARDLQRIREEIETLGSAVLNAQDDAVRAALEGDRRLANSIVLGDHRINRMTRTISHLCHTFLAVHLPSAGHLRLVASSLRLVNELERIGDYAAIIAREALQLPHPPAGLLRDEVFNMAEQAHDALRQSLAAFNRMDAELARSTLAIAAKGKGLGDQVFLELVEESEKRVEDVRYHFDIMIMVGRLKRSCDRAKNICEETLFSITGEDKELKTYDILFIDGDNGCRSRLAEAIARKYYPAGGHYSSAGVRNGGAPREDLAKFMEMHGLTNGPQGCRLLDPSEELISQYQVVVSLDGPIDRYIPTQPFRTVFLEWDVGAVPAGRTDSTDLSGFVGIFREIGVRVRELMEVLHGEEVD